VLFRSLARYPTLISLSATSHGNLIGNQAGSCITQSEVWSRDERDNRAEIEELRHAYEDLRKEHDAALAELQVRAAAPGCGNGLDASSKQTADRDFGSLKIENEELRAAQAAGLEVLQAMVASPGDTQPVFDLIARRAAELCAVPVAAVAMLDGTMLHLATQKGFDPAFTSVYASQFPRPVGPDTVMGRTILSRRVEQIEDVDAEPAYGIALAFGPRSLMGVPLLRNGEPLGVISVGRPVVGRFPDSLATLLQTFAEQAVIAITSAETYRALQERTAALAQRNTEYGERIEHQSATIDVLKAMANSPGDPRPVFELIVHHANKLCDGSGVGLFEFDGRMVHLRANLFGDAAEDKIANYRAMFPMVPNRGSVTCRAILDKQIMHITDFQSDPEIHPAVKAMGYQSQLSIPLIRDGAAIGVISLGGPIGGFTDSQVALLQTFAEQAVIAITSAETYRALQERTAALAQRNTEYGQRIEQQAATIDVLKVLSGSPGDPQPVFDQIAERARTFCETDFGAVTLVNDDKIFLQALAGTEAWAEQVRAAYPAPISPASAQGRAISTRSAVRIADTAADPEYPLPGVATVMRSVAVMPMLRDGVAIGGIGIGRTVAAPFSNIQMELLQTFAEQAVIAISSAKTYRALQARTADLQESLEYQTATSDVLRVISQSTFDLQPVLDMVAETAAQLCDAEQAAIYQHEGGLVRLVANCGFPAEYETFALGLGAFPLDRSPKNVGPRAIREGRAVHIHDVAAVPGYGENSIKFGRQRTSLGVPLMREGEAIGSIVLARQRVEPFTERQIDLVSIFADQAVIAIENTRLLTEQREALERQTAMAEILEAINTSPGHLAPVFDAVLEKAIRLCGSSFGTLSTYDGHVMHIAASHGLTQEQDTLLVDRPPAAGQPTGQIANGEDIVHLLDARDQDGYRDGFGPTRFFVDQVGARTAMWIALRKDQKLLGILTIFRREVRAFTDKEIELVRGFAAQAVIAMENARLINEQREALEQQIATTEVLRVINESAGTLAPVFDKLLDKARAVCGVDHAALELYDGERFYAAAVHGASDEFAELLRHGYRADASPAARALLNGQAFVEIADATQVDLATFQAAAAIDGVRTILFVPLRREKTLLGMIASARREVRRFTDKEISLLQNFAAQAVIAMENARLINETREALEQQKATAEILRVVNSSPGNLAPVFETILEKAHDLCGAAVGSLMIYEDGHAHAAATHGFPEKHVELMRQPFRPSARIVELIDGARLIHTLDCKFDGPDPDDEIGRSALNSADLRTGLWVPLRKDGTFLGWISSFRLEVRPFSDKEIALLESFAAHAVIAIENGRLLSEIRQRQEELRITFENMGDGVAMFDETQHLVAWNSKFQQIFDLPADLLKQHRTYEEHLRFLAAQGYFGTNVDTTEQIHALVATTGQSYAYERTRPDGRVIEIRRNPVPDGGFVLIFSDITERKRSEEEIRAARDAAEAAYRDLKTAQASLIQAEKMASLGQLTAGIAHEIKNPLNFVNNFASLSVDLLDELKQTAAPGLRLLDDARRAEIDDLTSTLASNLVKINEHGRRADGIVRSMLEHSRGSSGERRLVDLNALIEEALNLAYHGARAQDQTFNISLQRQLAEGIAPITLAPQDITRVLLNLFSNGFYAARERQRAKTTPGFQPSLKVSTRQLDGAVEILVRDNGIGIPSEIKDRLFQPFFTTKPPGEGTGLGLSMSYDIITQQHGGTISVDSKAGEYSEFTIRLPRNA
jgi:PAS domain S-box-containing protein